MLVISFGLCTRTDNIRDYAGLYTKYPFFFTFSLTLCPLSLRGLPPLAGFFEKLHLFWCGWQADLYFLVSIGLLTSVFSIYFYLKIIKLLMTGRNQEITPHVRNYIRSPLRSNNSIELSMIVCVKNIYYTRNINEPDYCNCLRYPFLVSRIYFLIQDSSY